MASVFQIAGADVRRRIRSVQIVTITWMIVETAASLFAARRAHSPALFAFGGDSAIELLSAAMVLWGFRAQAAQAHTERNVGRVVGGLLFALAAYVVATSFVSLAGHREPRPTLLGIAILIAAAVIMPLLAKEKRKLSAATGSAALRADAAQSGTCAYLSVIALVGLVANGVWRVAWADPVAALAIVPFVVWEGREALRGKPCGSC
jgi:divalent metal cation (Fe/Co/Zn/Cd) transporter